jgi:cysteine-rich repeat protein
MTNIFTTAKKGLSFVMAAFLLLNSALQPVVATGDLTRAMDLSGTPANQAMVSDHIEIMADVKPTVSSEWEAPTSPSSIGTAQAVPSTYTTDWDLTNPQACVSKVEVCNGLDDDCDGLIDEGLICESCIDTDKDGICDNVDNCPTVPNPNQQDSNHNGIGDACEQGEGCVIRVEVCNGLDDDCDGLIDEGLICDQCPDKDNDGICDNVDNCPAVYNPNQADSDGDGIGDACDEGEECVPTTEVCNGVDDDCDTSIDEGGVCTTCPDADADGVCDNVDNCPTTYNPNQQDSNNNGVGDVCEPSGELCPDPVSLTLTSHTHNQQVTTQNVTLTGTVQGNAGTIQVVVGTTTYTGTVTNGVWSATVTLQPGANVVWVKGMHANGNANCTYIIDIVLYYTGTTCPDADNDGICDDVDNCPAVYNPNQADSDNDGIGDACDSTGPVCPNPITSVQVTSHTNNQAVTSPTVPVLSGTVAGNAVRVDVIIGGTTYTDLTIVNGVWSVENVVLPVIGQNQITITAYHANGNSQCSFTSFFQLYRSNNSIVTSCTETQVTPAHVILNQGNFTITCEGNHETSFAVSVTRPSGGNAIFPLAPGVNTMQLSGNMLGVYTFQCIAYGSPLAFCPTATGTVIDTSSLCVDPITNLTISSHAHHQIVNTGNITLTGLVVGWVQKVDVMLGMNVYPTTISNGVWSVNVPLVTGANGIWVTAYPNDTDCSLVELDIVVNYQPAANVCTDPVTNLTITSHTNNQTVNSGTITLTGQVAGGVQKVDVMLGTTVYPTTINNGVRSVNVPLASGANEIWVKAYPLDTDCLPVQLDITVNNQPWLVTTCVETNLNPSNVQLNNGQFTVTCEGTNVTSFNVQVTQPNGFTTYLTTASNGAGNQFQFTPSLTGQHTFVCHAEGFNDTICPSTVGTVTTPGSNVCTDPVTNLTITSHTDNQTVTTGTIALSGQVAGGVQKVDVMIGTTVYPTTISNGIWSVNVPLASGANEIWVKAYPTDTDCLPVQLDINVNYQPTTNVCTDPVTNLTITSHTDNQNVTVRLITLTGQVSSGAQKVDVMLGTTVYPTTISNGVWSVSVSLQEGANEIWVKAYPNDADCSPVQLDINVNYQTWLVTTCVETNLQPASVQLNNGNFTITCEGTNVTSFEVQVTQPNGFTTYLTTASNGAGNQFQFTPSLTGQYTFVCHAEGFNDTICPSTVGTVTTPGSNVCTDPVTNLTITSHTNNQNVTTGTIALSGQVAGGVQRVDVMIGSGVYPTTIATGVWSVNVPLASGANEIWVKAYPNDTDCSPVQLDINVNYTPTTGGVCTAPLSYFNIDAPLSGMTTSASSIQIQWTVLQSTNVQTVLVNGVVATLSGSVFTATVALQPGANTIVATAISVDGDCTPLTDQISVTRQTGGWVCEYPLPSDAVVISSPLSGSVVTGSILQLTWTSGTGVASVTVLVNGVTITTLTPSAGNWNTAVTLASGSNNIQVVANPSDPDCSPVTQTITVRYNTTTDGFCPFPIDLSVTAPTNNLSTTQRTVTVQWVVAWTNVVLRIGNTIVTPNASGQYTYSYPLVVGTNTITITASNGDDDCTKTSTVTVTRRSSGGGGGGTQSSITCGNDRLDRYEQCDDGNRRNGDGCSNTCQFERAAVCGNNRIERTETCDDGNRRNGDGCDSSCRLEDIEFDKEIIKKRRPVPYVFVAPKVLPKTGISSRIAPARQAK